MVLQESLARGQSIVGLTAGEKVTMIATDQQLSAMAELAFTDPNFNFQAALGAILMSEPDNAVAVTAAATDAAEQDRIPRPIRTLGEPGPFRSSTNHQAHLSREDLSHERLRLLSNRVHV